MVDAWVCAGALPSILCDPRDPDLVRESLAVFDGLVLSGGSDVSPISYGQHALREAWRGDRRRDLYEIACVHAALELGLPVFGICRGAQILNVAFGGTLYQDIETQVESALVHRDQERYDTLMHEVSLEPQSWLAAQLGAAQRRVNSVHHQAIDELGAGLRVVARATDGTIEAIEREPTDKEAIECEPTRTKQRSNAITRTKRVASRRPELTASWRPCSGTPNGSVISRSRSSKRLSPSARKQRFARASV